MRSGHAATAITSVLSAGVGTRDATGYAIRLATFRLEQSELGRAALGIVTPRPAASAAIVGLLSGRIAPAYGELRVLGRDMTTQAGRAAVRRQVGIARRGGLVWPATTVRKLVERAARRSASPSAGGSGESPPSADTADRTLLVAAILDRLALMPWAEVPLRAAPHLVGRRARLAAACVHEPSLLIIDGLFDHLGVRDRAILAGIITELERDMSVVAIDRDADSLLLFCDQVITLADGILLGRTSPLAPMYELSQLSPLDHAR
jgi:branched-chain amino acid transport system ATP-binding protein